MFIYFYFVLYHWFCCISQKINPNHRAEEKKINTDITILVNAFSLNQLWEGLHTSGFSVAYGLQMHFIQKTSSN